MVQMPWMLSAGLFTVGAVLTAEQEGNPGGLQGSSPALGTSSGHEGGLSFTGRGRKGVARVTFSGQGSGYPGLWPGCVIRAPGAGSPSPINVSGLEFFPGDHCLRNKFNGPNISVTVFVPSSIPSTVGADG